MVISCAPRAGRASSRSLTLPLSCTLLSQLGGWWSIENPKGSYLFWYPSIAKLFELQSANLVHFDQCMYGLRPPGGQPHQRTRKSTSLLSNIASLQSLSIQCDGQHEHVWALGSATVNGKSISRAAAAGAYPAPLCSRWAALVARQLGHGRRPGLRSSDRRDCCQPGAGSVRHEGTHTTQQPLSTSLGHVARGHREPPARCGISEPGGGHSDRGDAGRAITAA